MGYDTAHPNARLLSERHYRQAVPTFVKEAEKPNSVASAGESYWEWSHKYVDEKFVSTKKPKRSQLAPNLFWSMVYGLEDEWEWEAGSDLQDQIELYIEQLNEIVSVANEDIQSLPEHQRTDDLLAYLGGRKVDTVEWVRCVIEIGESFRSESAGLKNDEGKMAELVSETIARLEETKYDGR